MLRAIGRGYCDAVSVGRAAHERVLGVVHGVDPRAGRVDAEFAEAVAARHRSLHHECVDAGSQGAARALRQIALDQARSACASDHRCFVVAGDDRCGVGGRGSTGNAFDASERKGAEYISSRIQPVDRADLGVSGIIDFVESVQVTQVQHVNIARTANDHISAARVGIDVIRPCTRRDRVDFGSAMDGVVPASRGDGVCAVTCLDAIVATHRSDRINAAAGKDDVVARAGGDRVGAVAGDYDVVATANRDRICANAGDDPVIACKCRAGGDRVGAITGAYVVVAASQCDRIRATAGGYRVIANSGRTNGDRVCPVAHVDHIVASAKRNRANTRSQATSDGIVTVATGDCRGTGTDIDDVIAIKESDGVDAATGRDDVVASACNNRTGPVAGVNRVVA